MTKCSVAVTRNRSAGSNRDAARARPGAITTSSSTAPIATADHACRPSARRCLRVPELTRRTGEDDAEDERGDAEQPGADEEERVGIEQRPSRGKPLHPYPGEALREFADVGV